jgi:ElaA protein
MQWHLKTFQELSNFELYKILQLRIDIFVVEQDCPYHDLDNKDLDKGALHLFAVDNDNIACYLRILPPDCSYPGMPSLGRVVTHASYRGTGIGHVLMSRATETLDQLWPTSTCHISAQAHLQGFYSRHGFHAVGESYLEDDIPHIGMERPAAN